MEMVCKRCGTKVQKETDEMLKTEYEYYCPECDENLYCFEVMEVCTENQNLHIEERSMKRYDWV